MDTKKIRADAKLKTLPAERQALIMEYLQGHSLAEAADWLKQDGFSTSRAALSEFFSWYQLKRQFREDESTTETLIEELKRDVPNLTEAQLDDMGQRTFSLLAMRRQDLDGFVKVRSARTKGEIEKAKLQLRNQAEARLRESLNLAQQKFQRDTCDLFLRWAEDKRAKDIASSPITNSEKIERLGSLMFGEDWKPTRP